MTLCPIAVVAGCKKCPAFRICPLKGVLGDEPEAPPSAPAKSTRPAASVSAAKPAKAATRRKTAAK